MIRFVADTGEQTWERMRDFYEMGKNLPSWGELTHSERHTIGNFVAPALSNIAEFMRFLDAARVASDAIRPEHFGGP